MKGEWLQRDIPGVRANELVWSPDPDFSIHPNDRDKVHWKGKKGRWIHLTIPGTLDDKEFLWWPTEGRDDQQLKSSPDGVFAKDSKAYLRYPLSPKDTIMFDAPVSIEDARESKSAWRQCIEANFKTDRRSSGKSTDLDRGMMDSGLNNTGDLKNFMIRSIGCDAYGQASNITWQMFDLHLDVWLRFFESDFAEIYALQNGRDPVYLAEKKERHAPLLVTWFESDVMHIEQAFRGFKLLVGRQGAKRSQELGVFTFAQHYVDLLKQVGDLKIGGPDNPYYHTTSTKTVGEILRERSAL